MISELYEAFKETEASDLFFHTIENIVNDEELNAKLGYLTHILQALSDIYRIQIRFPMKFRGSNSTIFVNSKEFQLIRISRNQEHSRFNVSLQCLKYNISQILDVAPNPTSFDDIF